MGVGVGVGGGGGVLGVMDFPNNLIFCFVLGKCQTTSLHKLGGWGTPITNFCMYFSIPKGFLPP